MLALLLLALNLAPEEPTRPQPEFWSQFRVSIERNLGRPYVWGSCGMKSFDCSGFVWRVMFDNGILIKRTTARKLYLGLPRVPKSEQHDFGNLVFFDNAKHCGIMNGPATFYHAETSKGTNLSPFNSYWRAKACGFRRIPKP